MASACALAIFSGKIIFISRLSRSAERSKRIFTGGVVEANGICSAAFCESAALRLASSPSPSLLRKSTSPKGRGLGIAVQFPAEVQSLRACPLPLGGAVAQRLRGFESAEPEKTVKRSSRRTGVNLQFFRWEPTSLGLSRASSPWPVAGWVESRGREGGVGTPLPASGPAERPCPLEASKNLPRGAQRD